VLGLYPIGSRSISSGPFELVTVPLLLSALGGISFGGSALHGLLMPMSASGGLTFDGQAEWTTLNALSASGGIVFSGPSRLIFAGRAVRFVALPAGHRFRAGHSHYRFTPAPIRYRFRGLS
jgi:hypothetical protein